MTNLVTLEFFPEGQKMIDKNKFIIGQKKGQFAIDYFCYM